MRPDKSIKCQRSTATAVSTTFNSNSSFNNVQQQRQFQKCSTATAVSAAAVFDMNAKKIVKEPTCFKSLSNPTSTDLVITNSSSNFQNTKGISTGLSDFS